MENFTESSQGTPLLVTSGAHCIKVAEYIPKFSQEKCSPKNLVFSNISLAMIWYREPLSWGLSTRGVAKYSDFRLIEGYISETV